MKHEFEAKLEAASKEQLEAKKILEQKMAKHTDDLKSFFQSKLKKTKEDSLAAVKKKEAELGLKNDALEQLKKFINDFLHTSSKTRVK